MQRKSISLNVARQLWAHCGGFCQNPHCNRYLFVAVGDDVVSLANVAHIIGHGANGPRSEHELAEWIDKDGITNLIMLCLDCHKIVDELEDRFTVEQMREWKAAHEQKVQALFDIPIMKNERKILAEINDLLNKNGLIFREYGPYSTRVLTGEGGDVSILWRRRCLDSILPNNQRIVGLIEKNKAFFRYPWDLYGQMIGFKVHVDAFRDNCLLGQRVNDYKLFPREFDHFVKSKLGIAVPPLERKPDEELEFRRDQVSTFIERFLADHSFIRDMEQLDRARMLVTLVDGRTLRVFVTNTYYFSEYTFEKVMAMDPEVDAIIASCPSGTYSPEAKRLCIENRVGLFSLAEFMGAIRKQGDEFLNYLPSTWRKARIEEFRKVFFGSSLPKGVEVYLFGSYLRRQIHNDIDVLIVYSDVASKACVEQVERLLSTAAERERSTLDLTVCSSGEFATLQLDYDNLTQIYLSR